MVRSLTWFFNLWYVACHVSCERGVICLGCERGVMSLLGEVRGNLCLLGNSPIAFY